MAFVFEELILIGPPDWMVVPVPIDRAEAVPEMKSEYSKLDVPVPAVVIQVVLMADVLTLPESVLRCKVCFGRGM